MNRTTAIIIAFFAAALEAGGDAVIRVGLVHPVQLARMWNASAPIAAG